jgi:uncharacterized damage-inducible protein DinB
MIVKALQTFHDYSVWATGRILAAAAGATAEQLVAPAQHVYGSLHQILLHTLDTEWGWRMRCQHDLSTPDLSAEEFPTVAALEARWREEHSAMRAYLESLSEPDVAQIVRYTLDSGEVRERVLWHLLLHIFNHGTQHRSEAAALLTAYGHSPGDLDFTVFLRATQNGQ